MMAGDSKIEACEYIENNRLAVENYVTEVTVEVSQETELEKS